jgi:hypothetical protein
VSGEPAPPVVWYRGYYRTGCAGVIEALAADGTTVGVVAHLRKHSPTGMSWGYMGAGPADAARSLLVAVIGQAAVCPLCRGAAPLGCLCDLGYRYLPYHQFKAEVIADLPDEWTLARADLVWWLLKNMPGCADWLTGGEPSVPRQQVEGAP